MVRDVSYLPQVVGVSKKSRVRFYFKDDYEKKKTKDIIYENKKGNKCSSVNFNRCLEQQIIITLLKICRYFHKNSYDNCLW